MTTTVAMIGCGAIGAGVLERLHGDPQLRIATVVVPARSHARVRDVLARWAPAAALRDGLGGPAPDVVVECAGHSAIEEHVLPALERGLPCLIASVGALAAGGLAERLEAAARAGGTQVQLLSGAIGGIDALAAAQVGGLESVVYSGRKPPEAWRGTPAERVCDLGSLREAACLFDGSAGEAARLYPKNANVAATVSLAGLGLARTRVQLFADPTVAENVHHVVAAGAFGMFELTLRGRPLTTNPKTSALTVYSVVRALRNRVQPLSI